MGAAGIEWVEVRLLLQIVHCIGQPHTTIYLVLDVNRAEVEEH